MGGQGVVLSAGGAATRIERVASRGAAPTALAWLDGFLLVGDSSGCLRVHEVFDGTSRLVFAQTLPASSRSILSLRVSCTPRSSARAAATGASEGAAGAAGDRERGGGRAGGRDKLEVWALLPRGVLISLPWHLVRESMRRRAAMFAGGDRTKIPRVPTRSWFLKGQADTAAFVCAPARQMGLFSSGAAQYNTTVVGVGTNPAAAAFYAGAPDRGADLESLASALSDRLSTVVSSAISSFAKSWGWGGGDDDERAPAEADPYASDEDKVYEASAAAAGIDGADASDEGDREAGDAADHSTRGPASRSGSRTLTTQAELHDSPRSVVEAAVDPTGTLLATADSLGRVMLMELPDLRVLRMWKGYREAQLGWVEAADRWRGQWDGAAPPPPRERVTGTGAGAYLAIFVPRRGVLELWRARFGPRVAALVVGGAARLLPVPSTPRSGGRSDEQRGGRCFLVRAAPNHGAGGDRDATGTRECSVLEVRLGSRSQRVARAFFVEAGNQAEGVQAARAQALIQRLVESGVDPGPFAARRPASGAFVASPNPAERDWARLRECVANLQTPALLGRLVTALQDAGGAGKAYLHRAVYQLVLERLELGSTDAADVVDSDPVEAARRELVRELRLRCRVLQAYSAVDVGERDTLDDVLDGGASGGHGVGGGAAADALSNSEFGRPVLLWQGISAWLRNGGGDGADDGGARVREAEAAAPPASQLSCVDMLNAFEATDDVVEGAAPPAASASTVRFRLRRHFSPAGRARVAVFVFSSLLTDPFALDAMLKIVDILGLPQGDMLSLFADFWFCTPLSSLLSASGNAASSALLRWLRLQAREAIAAATAPPGESTGADARPGRPVRPFSELLDACLHSPKVLHAMLLVRLVCDAVAAASATSSTPSSTRPSDGDKRAAKVAARALRVCQRLAVRLGRTCALGFKALVEATSRAADGGAGGAAAAADAALSVYVVGSGEVSPSGVLAHAQLFTDAGGEEASSLAATSAATQTSQLSLNAPRVAEQAAADAEAAAALVSAADVPLPAGTTKAAEAMRDADVELLLAQEVMRSGAPAAVAVQAMLPSDCAPGDYVAAHRAWSLATLWEAQLWHVEVVAAAVEHARRVQAHVVRAAVAHSLWSRFLLPRLRAVYDHVCAQPAGGGAAGRGTGHASHGAALGEGMFGRGARQPDLGALVLREAWSLSLIRAGYACLQCLFSSGVVEVRAAGARDDDGNEDDERDASPVRPVPASVAAVRGRDSWPPAEDMLIQDIVDLLGETRLALQAVRAHAVLLQAMACLTVAGQGFRLGALFSASTFACAVGSSPFAPDCLVAVRPAVATESEAVAAQSERRAAGRAGLTSTDSSDGLEAAVVPGIRGGAGGSGGHRAVLVVSDETESDAEVFDVASAGFGRGAYVDEVLTLAVSRNGTIGGLGPHGSPELADEVPPTVAAARLQLIVQLLTAAPALAAAAAAVSSASTRRRARSSGARAPGHGSPGGAAAGGATAGTADIALNAVPLGAALGVPKDAAAVRLALLLYVQGDDTRADEHFSQLPSSAAVSLAPQLVEVARQRLRATLERLRAHDTLSFLMVHVDPRTEEWIGAGDAEQLDVDEPVRLVPLADTHALLLRAAPLVPDSSAIASRVAELSTLALDLAGEIEAAGGDDELA